MPKNTKEGVDNSIMANSIELLINLGIDSTQSKKNTDLAIQGLKKYYDRNPLLINVDFNKGLALNNLNKMIKEMSSKKIELDVGIKGSGNSNYFDGIGKQANQASEEIKELQRLMNSVGKSKGRSGAGSVDFFNLDIDKVLIQLDNLGRKGIVATNDLSKFRGMLESIRNTGDRLSLKAITTDIFNISSGATHADKVLNGLNQALNQVGQAQQKLTGIKDKVELNPKSLAEYERLDILIKSLTTDLFKLQDTASRGGADEIQLARQMRSVKDRIKEAKYELDQFNTTAKSGQSLENVVIQANRLKDSLEKAGTVSSARLDTFSKAVEGISKSSMSAESKITHLRRAMDSLKDVNKGNVVDIKLGEGILKAQDNLKVIEDRINRVAKVYKKDFDPNMLEAVNRELAVMKTRSQSITDLKGLRDYNRDVKELARGVRNYQNAAVDASRQTKTFGEYLNTAFKKFPVWMMSATLFYAPIRGLKDLTEQVLMLDEALVSMKRVDIIAPHSSDAMLNTEYAGNPSYSFN